MAYTTDHGVPDIDATHTWAPATGPAPPVINDHGTSWIQLLGIDGFHDAPEADDFREPKTNAHGEYVVPGFKLGRTIVYEAQVMAENEAEVRRLITATRRGYATDMSSEGTMTVVPYSGIGGPTWTFKARVIAYDPENIFNYNKHRQWKFRWAFSISLRMSDPKFYSGGVGYE